MKFHPILFSTPMVQAILEDGKTETRRVVKPQPKLHFRKDKQVDIYERTPGNWEVKDRLSACAFSRLDVIKCPYGKAGDVLWVRETFSKEAEHINPDGFLYKADTPEWLTTVDGKWKPAIHMPKEACRLFLEITEIGIERLTDISENDAINEGVKVIHQEGQALKVYQNYLLKEKLGTTNPIRSFRTLWESINGKDSWNENPFVWVVKFKRIDKPSNFI